MADFRDFLAKMQPLRPSFRTKSPKLTLLKRSIMDAYSYSANKVVRFESGQNGGFDTKSGQNGGFGSGHERKIRTF